MNHTIFESKLPVDLRIDWSMRLNTTAGLTIFSRAKVPNYIYMCVCVCVCVYEYNMFVVYVYIYCACICVCMYEYTC